VTISVLSKQLQQGQKAHVRVGGWWVGGQQRGSSVACELSKSGDGTCRKEFSKG
jgi:hypothetical protein